MYVGLKMLTDFVTAEPETLVSKADALMVEHRMWMLIVQKNGTPVGYVTKEAVREALPSRATTLEKHELNYILSELTVEKILEKGVPTVTPETEIEVAAHRMYEESLHGLGVVDSGGKLIGYINRSVMLEVLVEEMGLKEGGSRIVFSVEDRKGVIAEVSGIIADMNIGIIATGTYYHDGKRILVFRLRTDDPAPVAEAVSARGFQIMGPEDFAAAWTKAL